MSEMRECRAALLALPDLVPRLHDRIQSLRRYSARHTLDVDDAEALALAGT
jgi:hypothetical protein